LFQEPIKERRTPGFSSSKSEALLLVIRIRQAATKKATNIGDCMSSNEGEKLSKVISNLTIKQFNGRT
jgi:hypothetical protein